MEVTIGLPVYNAGPLLVPALRSIFAQTYQDWELIIMEDGSTDGSLEIARAVRDSRVAVHSDGRNRGRSIRLNQLAALAKGRYLARMDADDLMHPQRLARQVQALDARPDLDLIDTAIYSIDSASRPVGVRGLKGLCRHPATVLRHGLFHHPAVTGRTAWFRRHPYDPEFFRTEDHELWCRTLACSTFDRIVEPLYFYRDDAISVSKYLASSRECRKVYRRYGPSQVGGLKTAALIATAQLKGLTFRVLSGLGLRESLVALRNRPLTAGETAAAQEAISVIMATAVPGLDRREQTGFSMNLGRKVA